MTEYQYLTRKLGLRLIAQLPDSQPLNLSGKPDTVAPHVRFDEGDRVLAPLHYW